MTLKTPLDPLVREMIRIRLHDNRERAERLTEKAQTFSNILRNVPPSNSDYGPEIKRLLDKCMEDCDLLSEDLNLRLQIDLRRLATGPGVEEGQ